MHAERYSESTVSPTTILSMLDRDIENIKGKVDRRLEYNIDNFKNALLPREALRIMSEQTVKVKQPIGLFQMAFDTSNVSLEDINTKFAKGGFMVGDDIEKARQTALEKIKQNSLSMLDDFQPDTIASVNERLSNTLTNQHGMDEVLHKQIEQRKLTEQQP